MTPQAYKFVTLSSWPCQLVFFQQKITKILISGWRGLEKSGLPWKRNFIAGGVLHIELIASQVSMVAAGN